MLFIYYLSKNYWFLSSECHLEAIELWSSRLSIQAAAGDYVISQYHNSHQC